MRILLASDVPLDSPTFKAIFSGLERHYARRGHAVTLAAPLASVPGLKALAGRCDFVHLHLNGFLPALLRPIEVLRASPAPMMASFHNSGRMSSLPARRREAASRFAALIGGCRAVTVLSRFGERKLLEFLPGLAGRFAVVPEGWGDGAVPNTEAPPREDFVLCPARLIAEKGVDVLLMAWTGLKRPPRLVFAGRDQTGGQCRRLAERLGLKGGVDFLGLVERSRLMGLMRRSAFVVLPSRHEFFGMAALEAMALGRAVVSTSTGPADFIADGVSGLLVPPGDVAGLRRALERLLGDAALRRSLGRAAKIAASAYSWSAVADRYLELMGEAAKIYHNPRSPR